MSGGGANGKIGPAARTAIYSTGLEFIGMALQPHEQEGQTGVYKEEKKWEARKAETLKGSWKAIWALRSQIWTRDKVFFQRQDQF